jgi:hypothetical protein
MSAKQKMIDDLQRQINQLVERQRKVELIPADEIAEAFPQGAWDNGFIWFQFNLPYSFWLINEVKSYMENYHGEFKLCYEDQRISESGRAYYDLKYLGEDDNDASFDIVFQSSQEGTTCVIHQIGTETKEVPVYEVICQEGAMEEL